MRLLLVYAVRKPNRFSHVPRPALGLGYIASYLRKYHDINDIKIIEHSYEHNIDNLVRKYNPNIVGISSTTQEYNAAIMIADNIKNVDGNIKVVMGGHHITALPSTLTRSMDIGVLGEGEETFADIIKLYENNEFSETKLGETPGIIYWKDGKIAITNKRDLIRPIDKIPFPARDLLKVEKSTHIMTSRGCPYNCIYCSAASFWNSYRYHSPEYVVGEINELISKFGVRHILIEDDLFIANKKRVEQIAKLIKEEGINEKVTFNCQCRANLVNDEIMNYLKSMNVKFINVGVETGSEDVLRRIKVGSVTTQQNSDALKIAKKHGIKVHCFFMIGSPDESKEEMLETYQFIKDNPMNSGVISVMVPYPGTELWDYAKSKNIVSDNMNWDVFDMDFIKNNGEYLVVDDSISREDLKKMYIDIRKEIDKKKGFYLRNYNRMIEIYRGDIRTMPTKFRKLLDS